LVDRSNDAGRPEHKVGPWRRASGPVRFLVTATQTALIVERGTPL
jgi:hypothetical protein